MVSLRFWKTLRTYCYPFFFGALVFVFLPSCVQQPCVQQQKPAKCIQQSVEMFTFKE